MGINKTDTIFARLLMLSFFLPMHWQVPGLFLPLVYFIVRSRQQKARLQRNTLLAALLCTLPYFLYVVALPFTNGKFHDVAARLLEYRLGFLLVPVSLAFISDKLRKTIAEEINWFVYGVLAVSLAANLWFIVKYAISPGGFHGVNHVTYRNYFEGFTGQHPTYISMYMVLGTGWLLIYGNKLSKQLRLTLLALLMVFLLTLLAKSPLIALVLIFMHQAWLKRKKLGQYKWMITAMAATGIAACAFIPFIRQRVGEMAGLSGKVQGNVTDNSIYVRKMIWSVDKSMVQHYWLTGCGPGRLMHLLKTRYAFHSIYLGYDVSAYDPHNEYFYNWISFGLMGLLVVLTILSVQAITAYHRRNLLALYLLLTLAITFFTESVMTTQHGLLFGTLFCTLFFLMPEKRSDRFYSA